MPSGSLRVRSLASAVTLSTTLIMFQPALAGSPSAIATATSTGETAKVTKGGVQYVVPRGWTAGAGTGGVWLSSADQDVRIGLISVGAAPDAVGAVQKAWRLYKPAAGAAKIETPTLLATENGWDERVTARISPAVAGGSATHACAMRHGASWVVVMTEAAEPALEKHSGSINLAQGSVLAPGFKAESFVGRKPHHLDAERIKTLTAFIAKSMATLGVPGVAYALIDDGVVVAEGGLGVQELGKPDPVTANTLFMIGSNTKGMTTLLLAKLVDEGKLSWDQAVVDVYPAFRLGDAETTRKVLIRHLVCACTGMPRRDLDWILGTDSRATGAVTFDLLAATRPTSRFGEEYQYSNLMASAAGFVAAHVLYPELGLDAAYDRAMHDKIFTPLGMTSTTFDFGKALSLEHATPHGRDLAGNPAVGTVRFDYPAVSPAGLAWSTAHDMTRYVQNELAEGRSANGAVLYSARNLLARRTPFVTRSKDQYYGMGLMTDRIGGIPMVRHGGATFGFLTNWYAIPDANIGAVLLTNSEQGFLMLDPFGRKLMETVYDGKPLADAQINAAAEASRLTYASAVKDIQYPPTAEVSRRLASRYVSPELGHIAVRKDKGELLFDFGGFVAHMGMRMGAKDPTLVTTEPALELPAFVLEVRDGQNVLVVHDGQHEYVYQEAGA